MRAREITLKTEFGNSDMGLISASVDYKPVASVRICVGVLALAGFDRLKAYLVAELVMPVEVIEMAKANGSFRYLHAADRGMVNGPLTPKPQDRFQRRRHRAEAADMLQHRPAA